MHVPQPKYSRLTWKSLRRCGCTTTNLRAMPLASAKGSGHTTEGFQQRAPVRKAGVMVRGSCTCIHPCCRFGLWSAFARNATSTNTGVAIADRILCEADPAMVAAKRGQTQKSNSSQPACSVGNTPKRRHRCLPPQRSANIIWGMLARAPRRPRVGSALTTSHALASPPTNSALSCANPQGSAQSALTPALVP